MSVRAQETLQTQQSASRQRRVNSESQQPSLKEAGASMPDDDIVRVDTDLTNILFTAVDKNKRFITMLRQEDIRVLEDGVQQEAFTFERQTDLPLSLAILIDTSILQQVTLPIEKAAASAFVNTVLRPGKDEAAIISFTGDATLEQDLTNKVALLQRAINRVEIVLPPDPMIGSMGSSGTYPDPGIITSRVGTTAIWDAIWVTSDDLLSQKSIKNRRAIILLTDGVDTSSQQKRQDAIDRAVQADVTIYVIGIGDSNNYEGVEKDTLRKVSERTGGRAFFPKDEMDLRVAFGQIEQELRAQYLIAYSPTNKRREGSYRKVSIEVVNPELRKQKVRLMYRQGYFAKGPGSASVPPGTMRQQP
ncbi:MAG: VWA domain-containing protein [Acidobacteria bacterium]|nr:VWA domain-containing protein [Acidobacteriota bacterium]